MNKPLACATLCALASCLANAETYTWIGKNGSLTGNWEDTQCWQGGRRPDVHAEDSVISGNRYSAIYLPRSNQDYTITLGEDEFLTNCLMQVVSGSGMGGTITITGHGKKLTTRKAYGPGVNNICMANAKLRFVDVDVELRGCNAAGGEIVIGDGANFSTGGYALYCNTDKSVFTVEEGGNAFVTGVDNRGYSNVLSVKGGMLTVQDKIGANNEICLTGGMLCAAKPDKSVRVTFTGGTWTLPKKDSELLTYEDHALLPQGDGVLNAQTDSSAFVLGYGMALLSSEHESVENPGVYMTNVFFSGTIQVTNRNARTDFYTRGGDATMTIGKRGKLVVPVWSARAKGTTDEKHHHRFDLELFALTHGCYVAQDYVYNDFVNGVTIGANGDWDNVSLRTAQGTRESGHISRFVFNDYVTFDTLDWLNKTDTHAIGIYKADLSVTNLTVKGGGAVTLVTRTGGPTQAGAMSVEAGTALDLPGSISSAAVNVNTLSSLQLTADKLTLGPKAKLTLHAGRSSLQVGDFYADETSEIVIDCPVALMPGAVQTCLKTRSVGQQPKVTVTGSCAEGWNLKNVAGVIYLDDGTISPLPTTAAPYTWSGAVSGNFSADGNWFGGVVPNTASAADNKLVFTGFKNMVITNDLTSGMANYLSIFNLRFASGCGPVELHGNPLALNPSSYSTENSAIYDESDWPVAIYCKLMRPTAKFGLHNVGSSTLHIMGDLDVDTGANANIFTRGDVRLGGKVTAGSVIYFDKVSSENCLRIVKGGSLTLSRPDVTKQTNHDESTGATTLMVDEGGSFTTQGDAYDPGKAKISHVVNGTASLLGGVSPTVRDQVFTGTGTLVCGANVPVANGAARTVTLGGGLVFVPTGDWQTLSAAGDGATLTIRVDGAVTVSAQADWTYGSSGVATRTTAEERALVGAAGSTLTFAAADGVTRLSDPVVSDGIVVFESDAKVVPTGALCDVNWKTFAQAKEFVGMPKSSDEGKFRIVGGENCQLLQFKSRSGFAVFIR